jgi:hypothetical protein
LVDRELHLGFKAIGRGHFCTRFDLVAIGFECVVMM